MGNKVCEIVTDRILEELKKGEIPWQKPWFDTRRFIKHTNGKSYSLLNCMLLGEPGEYITFKQAQAEGGSVKKGAKSKIVVFWKMYQKETEDENGEKHVKTFPVLNYYKVFNVKDCDGVKTKYYNEKQYEHDTEKEAEKIISGYCDANQGLRIYRDELSDRAFYRPSEDFIRVPMMSQFEKVEEFYSTLFHEMTHSTGHWTRLGRFQENEKIAAFGSEDYSKEELIAELGAATLCAKCGVESESSFKNSAAYIQGWMKAIEDDPNLIVSAAGKADKAVAMILGEGEAEK